MNTHSEAASPPERTEELVERVARAIAEADHHTPWPEDNYNGRAQKRHFMALSRAALQSLGYAEMERALRGVEAWFAGYVANAGKGADEELAMVRAALRGDQEQGEG